MAALATGLAKIQTVEFLPVPVTDVDTELDTQHRTKQSNYWIIAIVILAVAVLAGGAMAVYCYCKRKAETPLFGIVKDQVDGLAKGKTEKDDQKDQELAAHVQYLKKIMEDFNQRERQEAVRRVARNEGAKLMAATRFTALPPQPYRNSPLPLPAPMPGSSTQGLDAPVSIERRTLINTSPAPEAICSPIGYRRHY